MPTLTVNGRQQYLDDSLAHSRLAALRELAAGSMTADERAQLDALENWSRLDTSLRRRSVEPAATERVTTAGYGETPRAERPAAVDRGGWVTTSVRDPHVEQYRTAGMRTIDAHSRSGTLSARAADRLDVVLRTRDPAGETARYLAAVADPDYGSAFGRMLADPATGHLRYSSREVEAIREVEAASQRAALLTSSTGMPLPLTVDPSIVRTGNGALNPIRELASVATIGTHDWRGVSSDGVTAAYVPEGTEATDATPTLAGPQLSTQQGRAFCSMSIEASQDWESLQGQLVALIDDARNVLDATMFLSGNGTNQPYGILGGNATYSLTTAQRVQTAGAAAYVVGDPWLLKAAIPARFITATTFAAAPATWDTTFRFVGGNSTEPVQFDSGRAGPFLGQPKVEWSTMGTGATTGTKLIIGGDFRTGYKIVDRIGMTAEVIPHLFGATNRLPLGVRGLYVYWRTGAGVIAQNAFRYLEVK